MSSEQEEADVDAWLDSDESIDDLFEKEFDVTQLDPSFGMVMDTFRGTLDADEGELSSRDSTLIKGVGMAMVDIDADDVSLGDELTAEEEAVATHTPWESTGDDVADPIVKATADVREANVSQTVSKREMMNLAAEAVEDFVKENVRKDGQDAAEIARLKFAARRRVAESFDKTTASMLATRERREQRANARRAERERNNRRQPMDTHEARRNNRKVYVDDQHEAPEWANLREGPNGGFYYYASDADDAAEDSGGAVGNAMGALRDLLSRSQMAKGRVYIDDESEAPEGVDVREGSRGGLYYEMGGESHAAAEGGEYPAEADQSDEVQDLLGRLSDEQFTELYAEMMGQWVGGTVEDYRDAYEESMDGIQMDEVVSWMDENDVTTPGAEENAQQREAERGQQQMEETVQSLPEQAVNLLWSAFGGDPSASEEERVSGLPDVADPSVVQAVADKLTATDEGPARARRDAVAGN